MTTSIESHGDDWGILHELGHLYIPDGFQGNDSHKGDEWLILQLPHLPPFIPGVFIRDHAGFEGDLRGSNVVKPINVQE